MRTPVRTLRWVLREIDDQEKAKANLDALATARLSHLVLQVAYGLSGSKRKPPRTDPKDFLPYPDWKPSSDESDGPDQPTKFILSELIKKHALPVHVFTALVSPKSSAA